MTTNQSKAVVLRAKLEAFDRTVLSTSIGDFNIGLTTGFLPSALTGHAAHVQPRSGRGCPGQYWDAEKQSWYNYFRDYDATLGRYLQSDPIGLAGGLNTYGYVSANPIIKIDQYGLSECACNKASWPTTDRTVTSGFTTGNRNVGGRIRPHTALDIRSSLGGAIFSIWPGTVTGNGVAGDAGNFVKIKHSNGYESSYSHTDSSLSLGTTVTQGMQIGTTDMSGASTGPHLHFVLRDPNGVRIDPTDILNGKCP